MDEQQLAAIAQLGELAPAILQQLTRIADAQERIASAMDHERIVNSLGSGVTGGDFDIASLGGKPICIGPQSPTRMFYFDGNGSPVTIQADGLEGTLVGLETYVVPAKTPGEDGNPHTKFLFQSDRGPFAVDAGSRTATASGLVRSMLVASDEILRKPISLTFSPGTQNATLVEVASRFTGEVLINSEPGRWPPVWEEKTQQLKEKLAQANSAPSESMDAAPVQSTPNRPSTQAQPKAAKKQPPKKDMATQVEPAAAAVNPEEPSLPEGLRRQLRYYKTEDPYAAWFAELEIQEGEGKLTRDEAQHLSEYGDAHLKWMRIHLAPDADGRSQLLSRIFEMSKAISLPREEAIQYLQGMFGKQATGELSPGEMCEFAMVLRTRQIEKEQKAAAAT